MKAYILIEVDPGVSLKDIIEGKAMSAGLASYEGVVSCDVVHGQYDVVVVVEGDQITIDRTIIKIRDLPFVRKTVSLLTLLLN